MTKSPLLSLASLPAVLLSAALALASAAFGGVPAAISYQGYLTDDAGDPLTGPVAITFRLFAVQGPAIWTEPHATVQLNEGRFAVALGEVAALPADFSQPLFLEIEVNGETLSPRLPLRSVPYALQAGKVDTNGVDRAAVAAGAIDKSKLANDIAGAGLAQNGDGSLRVALAGIGSAMIADSAISNQHISSTAAIAPSKISGTAVTLNGNETLTGKTLSNPVLTIDDSRFTITDDADPTYSVRLQLDPKPTRALQRTLIVPDASGTLALESYVQTYVGTQIGALAPVASSGLYKDLLNAPALTPVATSGSFADLTGVPSFARLDMPNTFTAASQAITLDPIGAYPNTTLLQVLGSLGRTGPGLFTVDTEGDVTAMSFAGNGAGLTNLQSANLTGAISLSLLPTIPVTQIDGLAAVATSGSFIDLGNVPDFARRNTNNAFVGQNTFRSTEASADAITLMVLSSPSIPEPVFTVDSEGDVVANSFTGDGAGLTNLDADALSSGTVSLALLPNKIPNTKIDGLAAVATSGSFADLGNVPDFARRDTANVFAGGNTFTAPGLAISIDPAGAAPDATLLQVMSSLPVRTGYPQPVFRVDAEGDVVANSFAGDGSGLLNLNASQLLTGYLSPDRIDDLPVGKITGLADVATSGSFLNLSDTPDFARRDEANVFTANSLPISMEPVYPGYNTVLLQIMPQSFVRTGEGPPPVFTVDAEGDVMGNSFAGYQFTASGLISVQPGYTYPNDALLQVFPGGPVRTGAVFTVDTEGDVVANSFAGNGAGLTNLAASNLVGTIPFTQVTVDSKAISNTMLANDAFAVTLDTNLTGSTNVALGGTLTLSVNTTNLSGTIAGSGLMAAGSQLAVKLSEVATGLVGTGLKDGGSRLDVDTASLIGWGLTDVDGKFTVNTNELSGDMAGWGLFAGENLLQVNFPVVASELAGTGLMAGDGDLLVDNAQLAPSLAGKGLRHDALNDTLAIEFDAGLTLNGNLLAPDVDDTTVTINGDGKLAVPIDNTTIGLDVASKLAVRSVVSVPIVLDTNVPTVPAHGSLVFVDGALQVYNDPDGVGGDPGQWIKIGTYQ